MPDFKLISQLPDQPDTPDLHVYCDGATRNTNPSTAGGYAFTVWSNDKLYYARSGTLVGDITNNLAELLAIASALKWCHNHGCLYPSVFSDSKLAVDFATGVAKPKDPRMKLCLSKVTHSFNWLVPTFQHVPRGKPQQSFTDMLANLGNYYDQDYTTLESHQLLFTAAKSWR